MGFRPLLKIMIWTKMKLLPDENSRGLGTQRRSPQENGLFRTIWMKGPRHLETFPTKTATSIVARVSALSSPSIRV